MKSRPAFLVDTFKLSELSQDILSVEEAVAGGFEKVPDRDVPGAFEVGDSPGDFDYTVVGPHRELHFYYELLHRFLAFGGELAVAFDLTIVHLGVAVDTLFGEAQPLDFARFQDPGGYFSGRFARMRGAFRNSSRRYTANRYLQVNSVHYRAAQAGDVRQALSRSTGTPVALSIVAAGAGV